MPVLCGAGCCSGGGYGLYYSVRNPLPLEYGHMQQVQRHAASITTFAYIGGVIGFLTSLTWPAPFWITAASFGALAIPRRSQNRSI